MPRLRKESENITPLQALAAEELYRRRRVRESIKFAASEIKGASWTPGDHIDMICRELQEIEAGRNDRLVIEMPPRHGKSFLSAIIFTAWYLAKHPHNSVMVTSYSATLAEKHAQEARSVYLSEVFQRAFGISASASRRAKLRDKAGEWQTAEKGSYYARGIMGSVTGLGCNVLVIDDPTKNAQEADSATYQERVWNEYQTTLQTRLAPGGAIVIIQTRWNVKDLSGRVQELEPDRWRKISLPAIDEGGAALWPERWPIEDLRAIREAVSSRTWQSLYQQKPTKPEGNLFRVRNIVVHDENSDWPLGETRWCRFWDLASTPKARASDDPDFTVGALVGIRMRRISVDRSVIYYPDVYLADVIYGRWGATERDRKIRATARTDGDNIPVVIEAVAGYKDAPERIGHELRGAAVVHAFSPIGEKSSHGRVETLEAAIENGRMHVLEADWNDFVFDQLSGFPNASHDDAVDALTGAVAWLLANKPASDKPVSAVRSQTPTWEIKGW